MGSHQIRLSALGRDVQVGNLYNYYIDGIFNCRVIVPQESISINKKLPETAKWFHLPQSILLKCELDEALGINSHVRISINNKSVDLSQLWFGDFRESSQAAEEEDNNGAQVTFVFRVCRRIEALCPKFIDSKLYEYQIQSGCEATHLVEQVIYGAEFIFSLQRTIDRQNETKENAERNLYLAAEEYFNQIFGRNSASPDLPAALDKVQCKILSSLNPGNEVDGSFRQSIQYLIDAMSFDKEDGHWKPVEITLRNIPEQMEARLRLERQNDVICRCKMRQDMYNRIMDFGGDAFNVAHVAHLEIFPQFKSVIHQFACLLGTLMRKIERFHETLMTTTNPERNIEERQISNLLSDMMCWLIQRSSEMEKIVWLIEGTQLKMLDLAKIEMLTATNKLNRAKVFVLKAEFYPSPLIESIYAYIGNPSAISAPLPVLPILSGDKRQLQKIREELQQFSAEAQSNSLLDQEELRHRYYIGITSEYPHFTDGTITTFGDSKKENDSPKKQQQGTEIKQERPFSGAEVNLSTGVCLSMEQRNNSIVTSQESSADTEVVHHQSLKSPQMNQASGLNQPDEEGRLVDEEDTKSEFLVDCMQAHCSIGDKLDENENCITEESVDDDGNQSIQYLKSTTSTSHREFCPRQ